MATGIEKFVNSNLQEANSSSLFFIARMSFHDQYACHP